MKVLWPYWVQPSRNLWQYHQGIPLCHQTQTAMHILWDVCQLSKLLLQYCGRLLGLNVCCKSPGLSLSCQAEAAFQSYRWMKPVYLLPGSLNIAPRALLSDAVSYTHLRAH